MCEYCGCQSLAAIDELTREHDEVVNLIGCLRPARLEGDVARMAEIARAIAAVLGPHTRVEEHGLFPALAGDFPEQIGALAAEHRRIEAVLAEAADGRTPSDPAWHNAPGDQLRRITVKRVPGVADAPEGEVSNLLHRTVRAGTELTLSAPFGDVALDDADTPLLLVSAGIGCTPMVGMLEHIAVSGSTRPVHVLHADRAPADHALRADTQRLVHQLPDARAEFWYEQDAADVPGARTGLMNLDGLDLPSDADVYLCGSLPFMRAVRTQLLKAGLPARQIRYEVFGPDLWLAHAEA